MVKAAQSWPSSGARALVAAGDQLRSGGDHAAAAEQYALALQKSPTWSEPFLALKALGRAELAYQIASSLMPRAPAAAIRTGGGRLAVFTIASHNYAAHARAFLENAALHYPEAERFLIVVDRERLPPSAYAQGSHQLLASELGIPGFDVMAFRYDVTELNTAVKPFAFSHLLDVELFDTVLYFDPDILVVAPSLSITGALEAGASIVLTPHLSRPPGSRPEPNDQTILRSGVFNLGFMGARRSAETSAFMAWWGRHLQFECLDRQSQGLFVDQRFVDLALAYGERLAICRSAGANVAYWNLTERPLRRDGETILAGDVPLEFFHFSGFDTRRPERLSKHTRLFDPIESDELRQLVADYSARLEHCGIGDVAGIPYSYGAFHSGRPIPRALRTDFAETVLVWDGDPFASAEALCDELAARRSHEVRAPTTPEHAAPRTGGTWHSTAKVARDLLVLAAMPRGAGLLSMVGILHRARGDQAAALSAYRTALNRAPADGELRMRLGHLLEEMGSFREAARHYAEALRLVPGWDRPQRQLASIGETELGLDVARGRLEPGIQQQPVTPGGELAIFTIARNADAVRARLALESALQHHPEAQAFLIGVDRDLDAARRLAPGIRVIDSAAIGIPGFAAMAFRYSTAELCAAVKPHAFRQLIEIEKFRSVLYVDPTAIMLGRSKAVLAALQSGASIVLTPRRLRIAEGHAAGDDITMMRRGVFHPGVIAMGQGAQSAEFLAWWSWHLQFKCLDRPDLGMHLDSKVLDLAPGHFEGAHICRSPGAHVGRWNIDERELALGDGGVLASGAPLEVLDVDGLTADGGILAEILQDYAARLDAAGHARAIELPYGYDYFHSGRPIPPALRTTATQLLGEWESDPFDAATHALAAPTA